MIWFGRSGYICTLGEMKDARDVKYNTVILVGYSSFEFCLREFIWGLCDREVFLPRTSWR